MRAYAALIHDHGRGGGGSWGAAPFAVKGCGCLAVTRNPLVRYYGQHDLHFVTFSCYRRRRYLGTPDARNAFVSILDEMRRRRGFRLIGFVVMPEHVHLLISEPEKGDPSKVLQVSKQKTARNLLGARKSSEHFWQRRFYDFNVWSTKKVKEKLDYMHLNPVKRKLVSVPGDWPWSSWSYYEKAVHGPIAIDSWEER